MTNYNTTFTLVGVTIFGATTVSWNARPDALDVKENPIVAIHPIPASGHSIVQKLGAGSPTFRFRFPLHDINLISRSPAAARSSDILTTLRYWLRNGNTLTFTCDYVTYTMNEAAGISVQITDMVPVEVPTTDGYVAAGANLDANYDVEIELIQYYAGGV